MEYGFCLLKPHIPPPFCLLKFEIDETLLNRNPCGRCAYDPSGNGCSDGGVGMVAAMDLKKFHLDFLIGKMTL